LTQHWAITTLAVAAVVLTAPLVVDLVLSIVGNLCPARRRGAGGKRAVRLAVVVPAHNAETMIARTVASIRAADRLAPVIVVAHGCSDATAEVAARAGAEVLELTAPGVRGKGAALREGFSAAIAMGANALLMVDADSVVSTNLIAATRTAMEAGAEATQCRYELALPKGNSARSRARLRALAFRGMNVFRPAGRVGLGFSAGVLGNGFALAESTLKRVPFPADSVAEDLEYHTSLVCSGLWVRWIEDAFVRAPLAAPGLANATQESRWAGGRLGMAGRSTDRLLLAFLRGRWRALGPLIEVWSLPLSHAVLILLLTAALPVPWIHVYAWFCAGTATLYVLGTILLGEEPERDLAALVAVPLHLAWKAVLLPLVLRQSRKQAEWVRTGREAPRP
jgi:cellulose synthase/poly-beta-1,6-N-acetylglucosamine synthase-like glycosyltransferase